MAEYKAKDGFIYDATAYYQYTYKFIERLSKTVTTTWKEVQGIRYARIKYGAEATEFVEYVVIGYKDNTVKLIEVTGASRAIIMGEIAKELGGEMAYGRVLDENAIRSTVREIEVRLENAKRKNH